MPRRADSCPNSGAGRCWSAKARRKRSNCWTKPPRARHKVWFGSGHGPVGAGEPWRMNEKLLGIAGVIVILALAWLLSSNRKAIRLRVVSAAFALQAGIAWLVIYTSWGPAGIH